MGVPTLRKNGLLDEHVPSRPSCVPTGAVCTFDSCFRSVRLGRDHWHSIRRRSIRDTRRGFCQLDSGNLHINFALNSIKDRDGSTYGQALVYDSHGIHIEDCVLAISAKWFPFNIHHSNIPALRISKLGMWRDGSVGRNAAARPSLSLP